ncbi:MAG: type 2 lanthipeptide synthetase LanM family protein [Kofleriaceae bacterium]
MARVVLSSERWALGLTIHERLNALRRDDADLSVDELAVDQHLQRWLTLFPFFRDRLLESVAAVHAIDETLLAEVLGRPLDDQCHTPRWVAELDSCISQPPSPPWSSAPAAGDLGGLLNLAAPWIASACQLLETEVRNVLGRAQTRPCDASAFVELARVALPEILLPRIARTLVLELNVRRMRNRLAGSTPEDRFRDFCRQLARPDDAYAIVREYPVLGRIIVESLETWRIVTLEFLTRLCADWCDLGVAFSPTDLGSITSVQWHRGDAHRGSRSVTEVVTTGGLRLFYKPRSLAVDIHFQELLGWVNDRGQHPPFATLKILDRGTHGWVGGVEQRGCESVDEVRRFYERQGAYLGLLHLLDATDVHFENAVACGEHPFLVDLETLFHPHLPSPHASVEPASRMLRHSVLRVGMLPHRSFASGFEAGIDLSAIGGAAGQQSPFPIASWLGVGTDEMRLHEDRPVTTERRNRPTLGGQAVHLADYADAFSTGFSSMYRCLRDHRDELLADDGPIARFGHDETRVVVRPTMVYASLRQASFHPDVLRDAVDRDALFGWLWSSNPDASWSSLAAAEANELRAGDIPLFTTRPMSKHLHAGSGAVFDNILDEPAMDSVRRKLTTLDDEDFARQSWIVRAALGSSATDASPRERRRIDVAAKPDQLQLLEQSMRIGDRIARTAVHGPDGAASWISAAPHAKGRASITPVGMALYDGVPGIALFCAHLARVSGEARFEHLARQALKTVRAQQDRLGSCGAFDGLGGVVYAFAHMGHMWGDSALIAEANAVARVATQRARDDRMFDVISGTAGCVMSLLALHDAAPSDVLIGSALELGDRLVEVSMKVEHGRAWSSPIASTGLLTGFGHGAAGIGWVLAELYQRSRNEIHRNAALDAFAYERSRYSPQNRNWPDLRGLHDSTDASFGLGWCHGAPGIVLSRLRAFACLKSEDVRNDVDEPLAHLDDAFGWGHCLCHGDFGNLETLYEARQSLGDEWSAPIDRQLSRAFQSGTANGWLLDGAEGLEPPGLMTGLAGIGFGLLRAAAPTRVPSVLRLASPTL